MRPYKDVQRRHRSMITAMRRRACKFNMRGPIYMYYKEGVALRYPPLDTVQEIGDLVIPLYFTQVTWDEFWPAWFARFWTPGTYISYPYTTARLQAYIEATYLP